MKRVMPVIITISLIIGLPIVQAATIQVSTTADSIEIDGQCSLREAISAANLDAKVDTCTAGSGADIIGLGPGTYTIQRSGRDEDKNDSGDLDILDDLTINRSGFGSVVEIDGADLDRVLHVHTGVELTINGITIMGGDATVGYEDGGGILNQGTLNLTNAVVRNCVASCGGAISNDGDAQLTITNSRIESNQAVGQGGAIDDNQTWNTTVITGSTIANNVAGTHGGAMLTYSVSLTDSTISGNQADGNGGGIFWPTSGGSLSTATNSTISGNQAGENGGGIYYGGTIAQLHPSNVTITDNTADADGDDDGAGGGVYIAQGGNIMMRNSIIAGNHDLSAGSFAEHSPDCVGVFTSYGYNLIGAAGAGVCSLSSATGDQIGAIAAAIDPLLGPLSNNGGGVFTHMPASDSPLVDAGDPAGCTDRRGTLLLTDQRGRDRHIDGPDADFDVTCDIGAAEWADMLFIGDFESGDTTAWSATVITEP